jgi:hypothetical protein
VKHLGVRVPPLMSEPPRVYAALASAIWILVSLPFTYLAYLYWNWPESVFAEWRGWIFGSVALACVLMATVVPPRYRVAIVGTKLRG